MPDHETCLIPSLNRGVEVAGVDTVRISYTGFAIPLDGSYTDLSALILTCTVSKGLLQVLVHLLYQSVALVSPKGQRQRYRRMTGNLGTELQLVFCMST
jgi:hypothetical protein